MLITLDVPDDLGNDYFASVPEKLRPNHQVFVDFLMRKQPPISDNNLDLPFPTLNRTQKVVTNDFINQLCEAEGI